MRPEIEQLYDIESYRNLERYVKRLRIGIRVHRAQYRAIGWLLFVVGLPLLTGAEAALSAGQFAAGLLHAVPFPAGVLLVNLTEK